MADEYADMSREALVERLCHIEPLVLTWGNHDHHDHHDGEDEFTLNHLINAVRAMHVDLRNLAGVTLERLQIVTTDQEKLDADAQQAEAAIQALTGVLSEVSGHVTNLAAIIQALKDAAAANQPLSFLAADQAVADAQVVVDKANALRDQAAAADQPVTPPAPPVSG